ncbi:MAG: arylesterase, partial [Caulobacteraceae bacterium]
KPGRRGFLATLLAVGASPALRGRRIVRRQVVTILGDSITSGLGLPIADALPTQLALAVSSLGVPVEVRGAGVSGDTVANGLARLQSSIRRGTDVCVVALGGNDLLQGLDPRITRANLIRIVARLRARRIAVVLAGFRAPNVVDPSYAHDFDAVFSAVARSEHVALYPNLLAGVAFHPALNQRDGLHPNAAGVRVIAAHLAPTVARVAEARARASRNGA